MGTYKDFDNAPSYGERKLRNVKRNMAQMVDALWACPIERKEWESVFSMLGSDYMALDVLYAGDWLEHKNMRDNDNVGISNKVRESINKKRINDEINTLGDAFREVILGKESLLDGITKYKSKM